MNLLDFRKSLFIDYTLTDGKGLASTMVVRETGSIKNYNDMAKTHRISTHLAMSRVLMGTPHPDGRTLATGKEVLKPAWEVPAL